jgi:hypothetical protein
LGLVVNRKRNGYTPGVTHGAQAWTDVVTHRAAFREGLERQTFGHDGADKILGARLSAVFGDVGVKTVGFVFGSRCEDDPKIVAHFSRLETRAR